MDFDQLVTIFQEAGYEPRSYSGRGMYGKECLGVPTDYPADLILDVIEVIPSLNSGRTEAYEMIFKFVKAVRGFQQDSLGMRQIVYWPQIAWEGEETEDEE